MRAPILVIAIFVLAACAGAQTDRASAPAPATASAGRSIVPGTIGAVVEAAAQGVRIQALDPEGPATRAGLRPGDLVVGYDGVAIASVRDFNSRVSRSSPGTVVRLSAQRGTQSFTAEVRVKQLRTGARL